MSAQAAADRTERRTIASRAETVANHAVRFFWLLASLIGTLGVTVSCSRDKRPGDGGAGVGTTGATAPSATTSSSRPEPPTQPPPEPPAEAAPDAPEERPSEADPSPPQEATRAAPLTWGVGELQAVGPAGPASAWPRGVALVDKQSQLLLVPLDRNEQFEASDAPPERFARYGRGPGITDRFAYWIDLEGRLLRAPLRDPSKVEPLHASARAGTRVAALSRGERELVAFVALVDDEPTSMLWSNSGEVLRVSPEGSSATSVALVPLGQGALVLTHEGRTGMSPVHARPVRVAARRVSLGEDRVVWVGPGSHPLTEIEAVSTGPKQVLGLVAAARSITEFGLARFAIDDALAPVDDTHWMLYPNGIDPAPVTAAPLCGGHYVFFALPSSARPRSPQELRVARIRGDAIEGAETLAQARAFNDISVASRPGGALLVWTADRHTWAATLRCPTAPAGP